VRLLTGRRLVVIMVEHEDRNARSTSAAVAQG